MTNDQTILITGVTGHQGGAVARALQSSGFRLRGLTRKPESDRAAELARRGVDIVKGDLDALRFRKCAARTRSVNLVTPTAKLSRESATEMERRKRNSHDSCVQVSVNSRRIREFFRVFAHSENNNHEPFSLVEPVLTTLLAFDLLIPSQTKGNTKL
jgi:NAD(P)-dependent dehydrogenase (short-subunit alcohol dehydrogenase family)